MPYAAVSARSDHAEAEASAESVQTRLLPLELLRTRQRSFKRLTQPACPRKRRLPPLAVDPRHHHAISSAWLARVGDNDGNCVENAACDIDTCRLTLLPRGFSDPEKPIIFAEDFWPKDVDATFQATNAQSAPRAWLTSEICSPSSSQPHCNV